MEWWGVGGLGALLIAFAYYTYVFFLKGDDVSSPPEEPVVVREGDAYEQRVTEHHARHEKALRLIRESKLRISLDILEIERKQARDERIEEAYKDLVEEIKRRNKLGHRQLDAGHPCDRRRAYSHLIDVNYLPHTWPLGDSELAEIAEANALGEVVADKLRSNGLGVDTGHQMAYDGSIFSRARKQKRMLITW